MLSFILLLYMHIWFLITAKTHTSSIAFPNHFGWLNHTIIARVFLNLMFLLKCQNFNCFDIYVCKFTSCSHTYPAKPQRSYIWVTLQLRGDQIRGIINVHLIQQAILAGRMIEMIRPFSHNLVYILYNSTRSYEMSSNWGSVYLSWHAVCLVKVYNM